MTKSATSNSTCAVEPLLPVELGAGRIKFAQGIKAGRWVFASGVMAQDFVNGIAPDVLAERMPHAGSPKREKEALRIFENIDAVLRAAGTDRNNLLRTDQYYTTVKAVPPYQQTRREFLKGRIPPSTSIAQQRFLLPGADMNIQAMAAVPGAGFTVEHLKHPQLQGRPTSGYSAAVTVGDYIFIPGITSLAVGDEPRRNGVAAAALMAEGAQWGGQPIKLETNFIIEKRMTGSLALAGATLDDVVHAQVYLADRDDYSAFNEAWVRHFGEAGPSVSVIPCTAHGLAPYDGKIEINVIAAKPAAPPPGAASTPGSRSPFAIRRRRSKPAIFSLFRREWRQTAMDFCRPPQPIRGSLISPRPRRRRPKRSSTISSGYAPPPARRLSTQCACCCFSPTSPNSIRSTKCGSADSADAHCRSRRWKFRARCRCPALR